MKVKGYEFKEPLIRDSYDRRAVLFRNNILESLQKIDLSEDDVDIPLEKNARMKAAASATWYFEGHHLYFSYGLAAKFVENLYVVSKVIELGVKALLEGEKTVEEFVRDFSEDRDVEQQRKEARKTLGVPEDCNDMEEIDRKYKALAKEHHPDAGGKVEKFKKINNAHKMLKRELAA